MLVKSVIPTGRDSFAIIVYYRPNYQSAASYLVMNMKERKKEREKTFFEGHQKDKKKNKKRRKKINNNIILTSLHMDESRGNLK